MRQGSSPKWNRDRLKTAIKRNVLPDTERNILAETWKDTSIVPTSGPGWVLRSKEVA